MVVLLITCLEYGGAETQVVRLAVQLKRRGWDPHVISMLPPSALVDDLTAEQIPVSSLHMRRGVPNPQAVFALATLMRQWQPDILHSHMVHANLLARLSQLLYRVPVVVSTAHNIDEGGRWREFGYRMTDALCDLTTNVSHAAMDRYVNIHAVSKHKYQMIPNGVDVEKFQRNPADRTRIRRELGLNDEFTWIAVGRFEAAKDHPTMLKAFAQVTAQQPTAKLLLVGHGTLEQETRDLAQSLGLTDSVHFLGTRRDIAAVMNAADAYLMSSAWEGMPLVLLEASAVGLPIVTTDVGGNREVVLDEESGLLLPPRNQKQLATAMLRMMHMSPEVRAAMGRVARAHVEQSFSLQRVADQYTDLYQELLARKGRTRQPGAV